MSEAFASNGSGGGIPHDIIDVRDVATSGVRRRAGEGVRAVLIVRSEAPPAAEAWCSLAPASVDVLGADTALVGARSFAEVRRAARELSRAISPEGNDHRIGIGGVLDARRSIDDSAEEARRATELAAAAGLTRTVIAYDDVFLVDAVTSDTRLRDRLVRILDPVVAHDRAKRQHLVRTLEQFFASDLSTSTTARKLGTHRHTIDYRLKKIEELLGFQLADYPNRQLIEIALLALRMQRSRAPATR